MDKLLCYGWFWLVTLLGTYAYGQSVLQQPVTLQRDDISLVEVLRELEGQCPVSFSYFGAQLNLEQKVAVPTRAQPLQAVLDTLSAQTGITYQLLGNQIVLREASGQTPIYLTVRDQETGQPLPYTSVRLRGSALGTVTNTDGAFVFHVPDRHAADTLLISFIGYDPYREVVSTMAKESNKTVLLSPATVVLAEVVVPDQSLTAKEVVQEAVARIPENYPSGPYLMEGFYREWCVRRPANDNTIFPSLVEAAVNIEDQGYKRDGRAKQHEKVFIKEIRRSAHSEDTWNKLSRLLLQNFVKYNGAMGNYDAFPPVLQFPNQLVYETLKTVAEDEEYFYVIAVPMPGSPATCELYISYDDYSIARIDLKGEGDAIQSVNFGKRPGPGRLTSVDNSLRFRRINHKMYPSYLRSHWKTRIVDPESNKELEDNTFFSELLVSDVKTGNSKEQTKKLADASMNPRVPLSAQTRPYHPDFWRHYNIIQENPLDEALRLLFQQQKPLEQQFSESSESSKRAKRKGSKRP